MKILISTLIGLMLFASAEAQQGRQNQEREVTLSVNDAYVPGGLQSTDEAFVVVSGLYPNGCYHWRRAETTREQNNVILIRSIAAVSQGMCIMVLVPFSNEVKLGSLESGQYTLRFLNGDGTYMEKMLTVN